MYEVTNSADNGIIFVSCHKTPNAAIQTQYPLTPVFTVTYCCEENQMQYKIKVCCCPAKNRKLKRHTGEPG